MLSMKQNRIWGKFTNYCS